RGTTMPKRHRNPLKLLMFNEPPYAERHVRWCERTVGEIIPYFLLDLYLTTSLQAVKFKKF
ncbi:MAG TPA: hypothetical protein VGN20_00765, partial [Mucilaginibacter sp.]